MYRWSKCPLLAKVSSVLHSGELHFAPAAHGLYPARFLPDRDTPQALTHCQAGVLKLLPRLIAWERHVDLWGMRYFCQAGLA